MIVSNERNLSRCVFCPQSALSIEGPLVVKCRDCSLPLLTLLVEFPEPARSLVVHLLVVLGTVLNVIHINSLTPHLIGEKTESQKVWGTCLRPYGNQYWTQTLWLHSRCSAILPLPIKKPLRREEKERLSCSLPWSLVPGVSQVSLISAPGTARGFWLP